MTINGNVKINKMMKNVPYNKLFTEKKKKGTKYEKCFGGKWCNIHF